MNKKHILFLLLTQLVMSTQANVSLLVEIAVKKYSQNLPVVLDDLQAGKLNHEVKEILKKELIGQYAHLFPIPTKLSLRHVRGITSVAISHDGKYILTGSYDTTARLWDAHTGEILQVLEGHTDVITSVAFSPDGRYVLTGSEDNTARLWDLHNLAAEPVVLKNYRLCC